MLKIRLSRTGKRHALQYRIVVSEARSKKEGKQVAQIGYWNPQEKKVVINKDSYQSWLSKGAKPTDAIRKLVNQ